MQGTDYNDLEQTPETTGSANKMLAANTVHLVRLLRSDPYPSS
jgi:hypothetical protein